MLQVYGDCRTSACSKTKYDIRHDASVNEADILHWFETLHGSGLDPLMTGASAMATSGIIWMLAGILLMLMHRSRPGCAVIASVLLAYVVADIVLKPIVCRERPFQVEDLEVLGALPTTWSFPSGHTASAFAGAASLMMFDRRIGAPALAFAALVGVSRMYLCVHWPTDVLAGAAVGVAAAVLVHMLVGRPEPADH